MNRIIGLDVFEGKPMPGEYRLTVHELGNGHREAVVSQVIGWEHVRTMRPDELEYLQDKYGQQDEADRRERNAKRAAKRAKARLRRLVKSMGLDSLLTLTYRANVTDEDTCKAHLKEFVRRMRRLIPGFSYVAAYERQERGAWHVHMAVHKLPLKLAASNGVKVKSWSVVRAVWRSVTGEAGGNIDERARKSRSAWRTAKLASYLSKYMLKAFAEGEEFRNRYSASSYSLPDPARLHLRGVQLGEMIELAYAFAADGCSRVVTSFLSDFKDVFFLASEPPPPA
jgi:hypothetical protein